MRADEVMRSMLMTDHEPVRPISESKAQQVSKSCYIVFTGLVPMETKRRGEGGGRRDRERERENEELRRSRSPLHYIDKNGMVTSVYSVPFCQKTRE